MPVISAVFMRSLLGKTIRLILMMICASTSKEERQYAYKSIACACGHGLLPTVNHAIDESDIGVTVIAERLRIQCVVWNIVFEKFFPRRFSLTNPAASLWTSSRSGCIGG
jgi:hypothetical protein